MIIRGAPAIGVAAAMGVALGVLHADAERLDAQFEAICETLARTRFNWPRCSRSLINA